MYNFPEMLFYFFCCHLSAYQFIIFILIRDQRQNERIALVACAAMGYIIELSFHVSFIVTSDLILLRSIKVETIPTTSFTYFRTPPPAAGPFVYSASTSSPITAASSAV